jgi:NAD(P)H-hydrate repair Nnr-like enzyme with NAD(P)H-hydrate dehydratase domain
VAIPEAMVIGCNETSGGGIDPESAERLIKLGTDCDAVVIGPGMTDPAAVAELTLAMLRRLNGPALVLDALAFSTLRAVEIPQDRVGKIIVTPHSGEMATFLDVRREDVVKNPLQAARRAAAALSAVVAMKGAETYVVAENGQAWLSRNGSIGLATSGSGHLGRYSRRSTGQRYGSLPGDSVGSLHAWSGRPKSDDETRRVRAPCARNTW